MRKKQEPSPVERRGRKPAFADVVLSDANINDAGKSGNIELLCPNGVRILLPQGMLDAYERVAAICLALTRVPKLTNNRKSS